MEMVLQDLSIVDYDLATRINPKIEPIWIDMLLARMKQRKSFQWRRTLTTNESIITLHVKPKKNKLDKRKWRKEDILSRYLSMYVSFNSLTLIYHTNTLFKTRKL